MESSPQSVSLRGPEPSSLGSAAVIVNFYSASIRCERNSSEHSGVFVTTAHSAIQQYVSIRVHGNDPAYSAVMTLLTPAGTVELGLGFFQRLTDCVLILREQIDRPIQFRAYHHGAKPPFVFQDAWIVTSSVPMPKRTVAELSHGCLQLKPVHHSPFSATRK